MIDTIRASSNGKWGQLSPVGIREEERLGKEMSEMFTGLHDGYTKVAGIASFVPRAIMTMYEFNYALALGNDSLDISAESGHQFSDLALFLCCRFGLFRISEKRCLEAADFSYGIKKLKHRTD